MTCTLRTGDEDHGGDDVRAVGVVLRHAERRAQDERDRHDRADHRQVVLRGTQSAIPQALCVCTVHCAPTHSLPTADLLHLSLFV